MKTAAAAMVRLESAYNEVSNVIRTANIDDKPATRAIAERFVISVESAKHALNIFWCTHDKGFQAVNIVLFSILFPRMRVKLTPEDSLESVSAYSMGRPGHAIKGLDVFAHLYAKSMRKPPRCADKAVFRAWKALNLCMFTRDGMVLRNQQYRTSIGNLFTLFPDLEVELGSIEFDMIDPDSAPLPIRDTMSIVRDPEKVREFPPGFIEQIEFIWKWLADNKDNPVVKTMLHDVLMQGSAFQDDGIKLNICHSGGLMA